MSTRQKRTVWYLGRWVSSRWYNKQMQAPAKTDERKVIRVNKRDNEKAVLKAALDLMVSNGEVYMDAQGRYSLADVRDD